MNETAARLMPPVSGIDLNRPSGSPIDQKPANVWASGAQMLNLSPPAGDQAAMLGINSEPMQSSSGAMSRENEESWASDLDKSGDDISGDPEGVWSADIEQAFQEALNIYPPCRNELIARYIKIRCGKSRTRKQVSSHIQVLARKKMREGKGMKHDPGSPQGPASAPVHLPTPASTASSTSPRDPIKLGGSPVAPIDKPSNPALPTHPLMMPNPITPELDKGMHLQQITNLFPHPFPFLPGMPFPNGAFPAAAFGTDLYSSLAMIKPVTPPEETTQKVSYLASKRLALKDFTAYVEHNGHRKEILSITTSVDGDLTDIPLDYLKEYFQAEMPRLRKVTPDALFLVRGWANLDFDEDNSSAMYAVDAHYASAVHYPSLRVRTLALSFGNAVVEKDEEIPASPTTNAFNGQYEYRLEKSEWCQWLVLFLTQLKDLESKTEQGDVLNNFSVLQEVRGIKEDKSEETLLVFGLLIDIGANSSTFFKLTQK
ncbi:unnamed protein product, partial [Mesorhabditis spiculigera]